MRIIIYSMALIPLLNTSAFCSEPCFRPHRLSAVFSSFSEHSNFNIMQIKHYKNSYQLAKNTFLHKKYGNSSKNTTSPEGSVELIEMIKNAKSKKETVNLKK